MPLSTISTYLGNSSLVHKSYAFFRDYPRTRLLILVGLPVLMLISFFFLPLMSMFSLSLLDGLPPGGTFTLDNYAMVLNDRYLSVLWRTVSLTAQTTFVVTVLGYSLAYSMVRFTKRTTLLLLLIILPFWTNYIVRMYALINIFQNGGVLSWVLNLLGVVDETMGILYTNEAVLLGLTYVWLPLATLPFYASLTNFETDLIDASKDLGAGPIKTFFTVTLPMTFNGLMAGIVLVAIPAFGSFITPGLLGGTEQVMVGNIIDQQFNQAFNWPFGAALGIVISVFMILILIVSAAVGTRAVTGRGGENT